MDLPELFSILVNGELFFCRSNCLPDNNECNLSNDDKIKLKNDFVQYFPSDRLEENFEKLVNDIESERNKVFISSWSFNKDDYALWKIYTDNSRFGVCVETTVQEINKVIKINSGYFMRGKAVEYSSRDFTDLMEFIKMKDAKSMLNEMINLLVFHKSEHYIYENEFRIVAFNENNSNQQGISFSFDISSFIKRVHISPLMPEWFLYVLMQLGGMSIGGDSQIDRMRLEMFKPLLVLKYSSINDKTKKS